MAGERPLRLRWPDAVVAYVLVLAGTFPIVAALHNRAIPAVVANYLAHAWLALIALTWYFFLGRHFPIGTVNDRQLRPWYLLAVGLVAVSAIETLVSPPGAGLRLSPAPTLLAQLVFLARIGPVAAAHLVDEDTELLRIHRRMRREPRQFAPLHPGGELGA